MNDHHDPVKRLLSTITEPEPPQALRERSLARAQAAWTPPRVADPWSRLWHSRPLRLVWAAAVALLVVANVALRIGPRARPQADAVAAASRERAGLEELQAVVELPRLRPEYVGVDAPRGRETRPPGLDLTNRRHGLEDKS